jgi:hypothetical protein
MRINEYELAGIDCDPETMGMEMDWEYHSAEEWLSACADNLDLRDSDTGEVVTAEQLGVTDDVYHQLIIDSLITSEAEGHVRTSTGRRVYAA